MSDSISLDVHNVDPMTLAFERVELHAEGVGRFTVVKFRCKTMTGQKVGFDMFIDREAFEHGDLIPVLLGGLAPNMPPIFDVTAGLDHEPEGGANDGQESE